MFKFLKSAGQKYIDMQKRNFDAIKDVFDGDDEQANEEAVKAEVITKEARDMGLGGDYRAVVEGETVKLEGKVPDQETLEKIVLTSGNVEGVAEVDVSGVEVEKAGEASVFHTVQKGDTLSAIARTYLGNAMKYPDIFEANKPMLKDPDLIYPGQVLRIPGGKAPAA